MSLAKLVGFALVMAGFVAWALFYAALPSSQAYNAQQCAVYGKSVDQCGNITLSFK